jgi:hypothetical protein
MLHWESEMNTRKGQNSTERPHKYCWLQLRS